MSLLKPEPPVAPRVVRRLYPVGLVAIALALAVGVLGGAVGFISALRAGVPAAAVAPFVATVAWAAALGATGLAWRVACEALLALFEVSESLKSARDPRPPRQ